MTEKQPYEIEGLRADGTVYTGEVLGEQTEEEARKLAEHYSTLWQHRVSLFRVPSVYEGSRGWLDTEKHFICAVAPEAG
jgi:hypothetical protein